MSDPLASDFDEQVNEEAESPGNVDAFASLSVGPRDWTVDTIIDQIKKNNVDLDPAFQRRSAWNDQKRSRFIESLILGVPIPQIVLAEQPTERGKFIVIDGKQRLLTLAGLTMPEYSFWDRPAFVDMNTIQTLNGIKVSDFTQLDQFENERRYLANAPIRCAVLSGTKNRDVFYDIFYRLNSGAVPLSGQELRQVFFKGAFARYLFEITGSVGPLHSLLGLDAPDPRLFDIELLLRFFAIKLGLFEYRGDLRAYLDQTMERLSQHWDEEKPRVESLYADLNALLERLNSVFGYQAIGRKITKGRLERRFNKAVFEVEAYYFSQVDPNILEQTPKDAFLEAFETLCGDPDFRGSIEATTKSVGRFRTRFSKFRDLINAVYGLALDALPPLAE